MNSEKVKEIKDCLEEEYTTITYHQKEGKTIKISFADILTLINELESELKTHKDRIIELEDGIAKSMLGCEFLPECTNDKLKQFAEMLKEKAFLFRGEVVIAYAVPCYKIDETLKECLKE